MFAIVRLVGSIVFLAILIALSGVAVSADGAERRSTAETTTYLDRLFVSDQVVQVFSSAAECDRSGINSCCSQTCGTASCLVSVFGAPASHIFEEPPRIIFSEPASDLLVQRMRFGLLRPPRAT